jgi:hypothetical protein
MSKKIRIPVRALGSEVPDPGIPELSTWVAAHYGMEADLITYKLEESLNGQESVDIPAAGGRFYLPRIVTSLQGIDDGVLRREPAMDHRDITLDANRILSVRKGAWCALPAPHLWGITDEYFQDREEFVVALCQCAQQLMRTMRDRGIRGHILLCDRYYEEEMEELAGPRVLCYAERPAENELALLLEHQRRIAVPSDWVSRALQFRDEFEIDRLTVVDPTRQALREVQSHFDPDSIEAGGYCKGGCPAYWNGIFDSAFILR